MSFLTLYLISVCTMLFFYWLDRQNRKYRELTYSELTLCVAYVLVPFVNTVAAIFTCGYFIVTLPFWNKQPFKKE